MDRLRIERLVALIDAALAEIEPPLTTWSHEDWKRHDIALAAIISRLETEDSARFNDGSEPCLTIAGISTTCTSGRHGLLRSWQNSARRKIESLQDACPGHVASAANAKVCGRCGIHIDALRPDDNDPFNLQGSGPAAIEPRDPREAEALFGEPASFERREG